MNSLTLFKLAAALTGAAVAGEALALLVGMHILGEGDNPWISLKNDALIGLDILCGLGLMGVALICRDPANSTWLYLFAAGSLLSHLYREWEYLAQASNPFCANRPLFAVNNLKLVGLILAAGLASLI